jgi:hypothetical protein
MLGAMDPSMFYVFQLLAVVWSVAMLVKAVNALRTGTPYTFAMWDGGMLRAGKELSRIGTQVKVGLSLFLALGCGLTLAAVISMDNGRWILMGGAGLCIVADWTLAQTPRA